MTSIPLFPLNTVLYPDGYLPLQIFEVRYLDMIRQCIMGEQPFGALDQVCVMSIGDHGGREEAGHLGALLIVQGTVRDEDRMMLEAPLRDELGGESRLGRRVSGSEDLPGGRQRTNPPDPPLPLDPGLGRLAGPDRPALAHLIGHHCILPQAAKTGRL